jgi:hypothetical protein
MYGYRVAKAKIGVDKAYSKTAKFRLHAAVGTVWQEILCPCQVAYSQKVSLKFELT